MKSNGSTSLSPVIRLSALLAAGWASALLLGCGAPPGTPVTQTYNAPVAYQPQQPATPGSPQPPPKQQPLNLRFQANAIDHQAIPQVPFAAPLASFSSDVTDVTVEEVDPQKSSLNLSVVWKEGQQLERSLFQIKPTTAGKIVGSTVSGPLKITEAICVSDNCQTIALRGERSPDKSQIQLRIYQRIEYMKADTPLKKEAPLLLKDAVKYHLPIRRFRIDVLGGASFERLVVSRPQVDEIEEPFFDDSDDTQVEVIGAPNAAPLTAPAHPSDSASHDTLPSDPDDNTVVISVVADNPAPPEILVIPLEPEDILPTPTPTPRPAPSPQTDNPPATTSAPPSETPTVVADAPDVVVTPHANEAFDLNLPLDVVGRNQYINNPQMITSAFEMNPPSALPPGEASARIAKVAKTFVEQNVQVYRNACNIFVITVLAVSGYPIDRNYVADEFDQLFSYNQQLQDWEKAAFSGIEDIDLVRSQDSVHATLENLTSGLSTVGQWPKTGSRRYGHVGFILKEGSDLFTIDASLDGRAPRMKRVKTKTYLMNSKRRQMNLFSEPNVL
ncbi:MAG: hypothetical protein H6626_13155 [Pseudobdellovibrionaceae bacterium]|nr:hypothetical protein [Bdellovibrionales bacterium]USN47120.1 MAG: hypothetical protein H6626_13155 [Pseudobdellovibrionaceae bacterium]